MRKVLGMLLIVYMVLSAVITTAYNILPSHAWEIAKHRNGLLIFDCDVDGLYMLNPFNNYGDDWLWLVRRD